MHTFRVPETVEIKPSRAQIAARADLKAQPFPFQQWAEFMWLDDVRAYSDEKTQTLSVVLLRRWQAVVAAFDAAKPGDPIALEDDDYARLRAIVERPVRMFERNNTAIAIACLPYVDAVLGATKTP